MVYCGKPSGGCYACRERKSRCDQRPEGCTQCKKAKRLCPGYRVLGDLIFRDESSNVVRKFKARESRAKHAVVISPPPLLQKDEDTNVDTSLEVVQQDPSPLTCYSLAPTIEDRATGFFITNYVVGMEGPGWGHLDYIADWYGAKGLEDGLHASMKAVGLAGYAHAVQAPSLLRNARYQYMKAIQYTNAALKDPVDVRKDSTLLSIMILSIFESITGSNQLSLKDWAEHVNGAAAVIKLRGPDQIKSPAGRRMLIQVTSSLLISCLQRGVGLPEHIVEYMTAAINFVSNPDPAFVVQDTMMKTAGLRADWLSSDPPAPETLLRRALSLDSILLDISTRVPPGWEYETIYTDAPSPYVYNGCYHIYYDHWMAQIWNALRVVRILLNGIIRDILLAGFARKPPLFTAPEYSAQFQLSTDVLFALQADILHTVPQHLSATLNSNKVSIAITQFVGSVTREGPPTVLMSGGSFLLWPLWFAGSMDSATKEVQEYVIRNLDAIGDLMGIMQAHLLAGLIKTGNDIRVWKAPWKDRKYGTSVEVK